MCVLSTSHHLQILSSEDSLPGLEGGVDGFVEGKEGGHTLVVVVIGGNGGLWVWEFMDE
jgi:hypothetical protein